MGEGVDKKRNHIYENGYLAAWAKERKERKGEKKRAQEDGRLPPSFILFERKLDYAAETEGNQYNYLI